MYVSNKRLYTTSSCLLISNLKNPHKRKVSLKTLLIYSSIDLNASNSQDVAVALNMHLNVSKDDNIPLLLRRLSLVEQIENTFDVKDVS